MKHGAFRSMMEEVLSKYREKVLDKIADKVKEAVEELISREIEIRAELCFRGKIGYPLSHEVPEDMYYYYSKEYKECYQQAKKEVMKG